MPTTGRQRSRRSSRRAANCWCRPKADGHGQRTPGPAMGRRPSSRPAWRAMSGRCARWCWPKVEADVCIHFGARNARLDCGHKGPRRRSAGILQYWCRQGNKADLDKPMRGDGTTPPAFVRGGNKRGQHQRAAGAGACQTKADLDKAPDARTTRPRSWRSVRTAPTRYGCWRRWCRPRRTWTRAGPATTRRPHSCGG